jgi:hypothetical protein
MSMEELLLGTLGEVANGSLGDVILEVGVNPAKGELLTLGFAGFAEHTVSKATIVAMVVLNAHAVLGGKLFEGMFCVDGLGGGQVACHEVDKLEAGVVVHEDSCIPVAGLGECSFCLPVKSWLR